MDNVKISLAIFGNQNSNSGFQPLYWINDPVQQLENMVPPGMEDNPYFFVLQTTPAYTMFTLVQNRVSSYMSSRAGALKMAITLPQGYRIQGGEGPMEVLLAIREKFIETCMTQNKGATQTFNFTDKLADEAVFTDILEQYHLEPARTPHIPMTGADEALLLLTPQNTSLLFMDPQRPEFAAYKRIVIGEKGKASSYNHVVTGLSIPRPVQHTVQTKQQVRTVQTQDDATQFTTRPTQTTQQQTTQPTQPGTGIEGRTPLPQRQSGLMAWLTKPWMPAVTLLAGLLAGYLIGACTASSPAVTDDDDEEETVYTERHEDEEFPQDEYDDEGDGDEGNGLSFDERLAGYQEQFEASILYFGLVDEMAEWIGNPDVMARCNEEDPSFVTRVCGYKEVVTLLREGNLTEAKNVAQRTQALSNRHLNQMRAAYKSYLDDNGRVVSYTAEQQNQALAYFASHYQDLQSFADINDIHNHIATAPQGNRQRGQQDNRQRSNQNAGGGSTQNQDPIER